MKYREKSFAPWICCAAVLATLSWETAFANPKGASPVYGNPQISSSGNTLQISTTSNAVINWDSFSISPGELTNFIQHSSKNIVLNRVTGASISSILGSLKSNGGLILINPNGVTFGNGCTVNVASLIASTLDVLDSDFINGNTLNFTGDSQNHLINVGTIKALDGDVILLAKFVQNQGSIETPNGLSALVAATDVLIKPVGPNRIFINPKNPKPSTLTGVYNEGSIEAFQAELQADGSAYSYAIKDVGKIDAIGVVKQDGHVYLVAEGGTILENGSITCNNQDGSGGNVQILAKNIILESKASISTSAANDGGTILIGGDVKGDTTVYKADAVITQKGVQVKANALGKGNGGKVVFWGNNGNVYAGNTEANGGPSGGNGGFVEVSSPNHLDVNQGKINVNAPGGGTIGTISFDPCAVTISALLPPFDYGHDFPNIFSPPYNFSFSGASSNFLPVTIATYLLGGNVTINAAATGTLPAGSGTIDVNSSITWPTATSLTLIADNYVNLNFVSIAPLLGDVNIQAPQVTITGNDILLPLAPSIACGTGAINITSPTSLTLNGSTTFTSSIQTAVGNITINTGTLSLNGDPTTLGASATINSGSGVIRINATGDITLNPGPAILPQSASITNGTSDIIINGQGNLTLNSSFGTQSYSSIETQLGGNISITLNGPSNNCTLHAGGSAGISSSIIKTIDGGNITLDITGDYTITGGNSVTFDSRAGVYTADLLGSGDIRISGSNYTLTAGGSPILFGDAKIFAGNNSLGTTGSVFMQANGLVTLTGGSSFSAVAGIEANQGNITITTPPGGTLNFNIFGGNASDSGGVIQTFNGGDISINGNSAAAAGSMTLLGGPSDSVARVATLNGGNITCLLPGDYSITGGSSSSGGDDSEAGIFSAFNSGTGSIVLGARNMTLQGGGGSGINYAEINTGPTATNSTISITATGLISLTGGNTGTSNNARIRTQPVTGTANNITIAANGINILSTAVPAATGVVAEITTQRGNINITTSNTISIQSGSQTTTPARIATLLSGDIIANASGGGLAGLTLEAVGDRATIETVNGGSITCNLTGDYSITGGASGVGNNAAAGIFTALSSGAGNIVLGARNITMHGGDGPGSNFVEISTGPTAVNNTISITATQGISLTGGIVPGVNNNGRIRTQPITGTANNITITTAGINIVSTTIPAVTGVVAEITTNRGDITITTSDTISIQSGSQATTPARIATLLSGNILANASGIGAAGVTLTAIGDRATIETVNGGTITLNLTGDYTIQAGTTTGISQVAQAGIFGSTNSGSGNVSVSGRTFSLTGGTGDGTATSPLPAETAEITIGPSASGSTITVNASDVITLQAGSASTPMANATNHSAFIRTQSTSGNNGITINCTGLTLLGSPTSNSVLAQASVLTQTGDISIDADILLQGGNAVQSVATITAQTGNIKFSNTDTMSLYGGSAPQAYAQIGVPNSATPIVGNIDLGNVSGRIVLSGGQAAQTYAQIGHGSPVGAASTSITGNITSSSIGGNVILQGNNSADTYAQIGHRSAVGSGTTIQGDITLLCLGDINATSGSGFGSYTLIGHGGASSDQVNNWSGNFTVTADDINLTAGGNVAFSSGFSVIGFANPAATTANATTISSTSFNVATTSDVFLQGSANGNDAGIGVLLFSQNASSSANVGNFNFNFLGNCTLQGLQQSNSFLGLDVDTVGAATMTSNLALTVGKNLALTSVAISNGDNALIQNSNPTHFTPGTGNVSIAVGGSTTLSSNLLGTTSIFSSGPLTLTTGTNLFLNNAVSSSALCSIQSNGNLSVTAGNNVTTLALGLVASVISNNSTTPGQRNALIEAVNGNVSLGGRSTASTTGDTLTIVAGKNITIGNFTSILNSSTDTSGKVILITDNLNPVSPAIGAGIGFFLAPGGAIDCFSGGVADSGPIRIYSTTQPMTTIGNTFSFLKPLNNTYFVKTTQFVDTPTEQWGFYSPTGTVDPVAPHYTVFYKDTGKPTPPIPPTPPTPPTPNQIPRGVVQRLEHLAGVENSQLFYMNEVDELDWLRFYSILFTVSEECSQAQLSWVCDRISNEKKEYTIRRQVYLNQHIPVTMDAIEEEQ